MVKSEILGKHILVEDVQTLFYFYFLIYINRAIPYGNDYQGIYVGTAKGCRVSPHIVHTEYPCVELSLMTNTCIEEP